MTYWFTKKKLRNSYVKIVRQSGTAESVARGAAIGIFISFIVPIGLQIPVAIGIAFLFKASKMTAFIFTFITNPYTVPFIYPILCYIGSFVIGEPLSIKVISNMLNDFYSDISFTEFLILSKGILIPLTVGGAIVGAILAIAGYYAVYKAVLGHRNRIISGMKRE